MNAVSRVAACLAASVALACGRPAPPAPPPPPVLAAPAEAAGGAVNMPPSIAVSGNAPSGDTTYGATVALSAACTDREDGALPAVRWSTDDGRLLGEGRTLQWMPEPGDYLVLATCTDRGARSTTVAASSRFSIIDRWTTADSVPVTLLVPYATNRRGDARPDSPGASFDDRLRDGITRGLLSVNVPARDFRADGETRRTPFMRSLRGNTAAVDATTFALSTIDAIDSATFASRFGGALAETSGGDILVFVHGYNTSFAGAARRAARLAADLRYPGAIVFFSWPSDALLSSYRADQRDARASGDALASFLSELWASRGARRLSILTHSMGAEVLAGALRTLADSSWLARTVRPARPLALGDVVLVSPDIAAGEFVESALPALTASAERITVYAAAADFALWSSWGSNRARRLGLGGRFATLVRGVDTIEVPYEDTDAIGHNPFASARVRDDLYRLLVRRLPAAERSLLVVPRAEGTSLWRLP